MLSESSFADICEQHKEKPSIVHHQNNQLNLAFGSKCLIKIASRISVLLAPPVFTAPGKEAVYPCLGPWKSVTAQKTHCSRSDVLWLPRPVMKSNTSRYLCQGVLSVTIRKRTWENRGGQNGREAAQEPCAWSPDSPSTDTTAVTGEPPRIQALALWIGCSCPPVQPNGRCEQKDAVTVGFKSYILGVSY